MHEPLIFGFCFPFCRCRPWKVRGTPKLYEVERTVQSMWKGARVDGRSDLHKLLLAAWKFPTMPQDVVRHMLYFEPRSEILCAGKADGE